MKNFLGNFKKRDFAVILIAIVALALLVYVIRMTRRQESIDQQELVNNITETTEDAGSDYGSNGRGYSIIINEVDSEGNIELYNSGSKSVDIGGYTVCVNDNSILLEEGASIDSKNFYIVKTGIKIDANDGNIVKIYGKNNELVRAISAGKLSSGISYGCLVDGSYEMAYISSSVGGSNEGSTVVSQNSVCFSVPSGFYEEPFDLEISAPDNCKIFYTLDGTIPTTESEVYASKISISRPSSSDFVYAVSDGKGYYHSSFSPKKVDKGTVVNAIAVNAAGKVISTGTASYYIGFNNDLDYVGLPVISIEVDPEEMFGFESGIYVPGKSYYDGYIQGDSSKGNYLNNKSANARIEYFESCKDLTYSDEVTISIINDERRGSEQKSLAIKAKNTFPIGTGIEKFLNSSSNSLVLLAGGTDSSAKIRDFFVKGILENSNVINRDYQPCIAFINGEYWGMYILATNYDEHFFKDNYGITDKVITVESDYNIPSSYSEFYNYVISTDFSDAENYRTIQSMMDVDNYIEFMCANVFIGNTLMNRNISACVFRTQGNTGKNFNDGRWRWAINDVDCTLANANSFIDPYTKGDYSAAIMNTYLSPGIRDNAFFNSLLQNNSFAKKYEETMDSLIEKCFTQELAVEVLGELEQNISRAVYATTLRFTSSEVNHFSNESKKIASFFATRREYLDMYTDEYIRAKGKVAGRITPENTSTEEVSEEYTDEAAEAASEESITKSN
jgi:hypothetical protein